jgi:hypothetical protein
MANILLQQTMMMMMMMMMMVEVLVSTTSLQVFEIRSSPSSFVYENDKSTFIKSTIRIKDRTRMF